MLLLLQRLAWDRHAPHVYSLASPSHGVKPADAHRLAERDLPNAVSATSVRMLVSHSPEGTDPFHIPPEDDLASGAEQRLSRRPAAAPSCVVVAVHCWFACED